MSWQSAALGSIMISALLGTALAISIGRASVVTYVVEVEPLQQAAAANSEPHLEGTVPTQTGFSPDHAETDISSLSIDLVTLREKVVSYLRLFLRR